jgi:ankyrin repeat protein
LNDVRLTTKAIEEDVSAIKQDTAQISTVKQDTSQIAFLVDEIQRLRDQVTRSEERDGRRLVLERFLDESTSYAETVVDIAEDDVATDPKPPGSPRSTHSYSGQVRAHSLLETVVDVAENDAAEDDAAESDTAEVDAAEDDVPGDDVAEVKVLLERGAFRDHKALYFAALAGQANTLNLCFLHMYPVNAGVFARALYFAAWGGHEAIARLLIDKGALINTKFLVNDIQPIPRAEEATPLYIAAAQNQLETAKMLLHLNADIDTEIKTKIEINDDKGLSAKVTSPFMVAAKHGFIDMLTLFSGFKRSRLVGACLIAAVVSKTFGVFEFLLEKYPEENAYRGLFEETLRYATDSQGRKILRQFLQSGYDVNQRNALGSTALEAACLSGDVNLVRMLLRYPVNADSISAALRFLESHPARPNSTAMIELIRGPSSHGSGNADFRRGPSHAGQRQLPDALSRKLSGPAPRPRRRFFGRFTKK